MEGKCDPTGTLKKISFSVVNRDPEELESEGEEDGVDELTNTSHALLDNTDQSV